MTTPRGPAREAAERELSEPRYDAYEPGLLRRGIDWVWDRVSGLLDAAVGGTPAGWVGVTVISVLVLLLITALRSRLGAVRPVPRTGTALFDDRPRSAAAHRAAAERHAADQRWDEALQERIRAVVRALEERAVLDPRPGRTAMEAAEEAGRVFPDQVTALSAAARAFDEVTYAARPADSSAYARVRDLDTALQNSRPQPAIVTSRRGDP